MHPLIQRLTARPPVVADGAWGTMLQAHGLKSGQCPDALNVSNPHAVVRVASAYVKAGSEVILTNTFRSNRISLEPYGLAEHAAQLSEAGVMLSRKAAGTVAVIASIGPSGRMLMTGDVTEDELRMAYREQAAALARAGADALLIETMSDLQEAKIALEEAKGTGLPVIVSMVFDSGKDRDRTMMGSTPEQVARELTAAGADAVGANCGLGIEGYIPVCSRLRAATDLPVWIKPNAGIPDLVEGRIIYKTTPADFARFAPALLRAGASFIGGCCGTTPDHIRALRATLHEPGGPPPAR